MNQNIKDLLERSLGIMEDITVFRQEADMAAQATFVMRLEDKDDEYEAGVSLQPELRKAAVYYYTERIVHKEAALKKCLLELRQELEKFKL